VTRLTYSTIASLDGFVEDSSGNFQWGAPDDEVATFINDMERNVGTYLYGRRMYETMVFWETAEPDESDPPSTRDWTQMWRSAEKVVYSRTLKEVSSRRTRIEREFDPESVRRLKETSGRDLSIGGAELAGQALRAGLIDEISLFVVPVALGGGKPWFPKATSLRLALVATHRFSGGFVLLRYHPT
jgi:dihydrofolate reductase